MFLFLISFFLIENFVLQDVQQQSGLGLRGLPVAHQEARVVVGGMKKKKCFQILEDWEFFFFFFFEMLFTECNSLSYTASCHIYFSK